MASARRGRGLFGRFERFEKWELALYALLLGYFVARVVFFALRIHPAVPPDEATHLGRCLAYAGVLGIPENGPATFEYGLIDQRPWLYYWLMGRLLDLNVFAMSNLAFLRLANGVLGLGTVLIAIAWMREWCSDPMVRSLFAVFVTNTLMFTGLSGAVSYDNLANLLAASSVFAFTCFRVRRSSTALLWFFASILAGCLAKRSLIPLAFLLLVLLALRERHHLPALRGEVRVLLGRLRSGLLVPAACALVLAGLVASLYAGNLARYGQLSPGFGQVVGEQNAMQNRIYARSRIVERFREQEISYREAQEMAQSIHHRGDRSDTLFLLKASRLPESSRVGRIEYASKWSRHMLAGAVSYLGHRRVTKSGAALYAYFGIFAIAGILMIRKLWLGQAGGTPADSLFLAAGYAFVLMWFVNHPSYMTSRVIELGAQGRYLFPVLLPVYGVLSYSLIESLPARARPFMAGAVGLFYLYGDFPWFLGQIDERWFTPVAL
jgi:hypothetical protein